jgi:hypothetical protein
LEYLPPTTEPFPVIAQILAINVLKRYVIIGQVIIQILIDLIT